MQALYVLLERKRVVMERVVKPGQFYKHFKNKLYQILTVAEHSETGEKMVVYQALYGNFRTYVRPYDMFVSEVDHVKYPEVTQTYRFELVNPCASESAGTVEREPEVKVEMNHESVLPVDLEETQPEEVGVNPNLLKFLDLDTLAEKLELFKDLRKTMDDHLLDSIAASLDIVVEDGPLAQRYQEVLRCLETMEHFECTRFR